MSDKTSIVICGGSLAGIATAIRLKQLGFQSSVLDKSRFPRPKLCGEFLGPDSFSCLKTLGLLEEISNRAYGPVEHAYFYSQSGKSLKVKLSWMSREYPYALAIPRETLDHLLLEKARELGIEIREQYRVLPGVSLTENQFVLLVQPCDASTGEVVSQQRADILIDATGRHGGLFLDADGARKTKSQPARFKNMIGIQCHARSPFQEKPDLKMFFFPGGYGGIQPIAPNEINICMLTTLDHLKQMGPLRAENYASVMQATMGQNPVAAELLTDTKPMGDILTTANLNLNPPTLDTRLLQIGDAMVTIDPFTGSGMAHALETGILAAQTVAKGLHEKKAYSEIRHAYLQAYRKKFAGRLQLLRCFRPMLFSEGFQEWSWPVLKPLLPTLAGIFR